MKMMFHIRYIGRKEVKASEPINTGGRYSLYALGLKIVYTDLIGLNKISLSLP